MREGVNEDSRPESGWVTFSSISCRHLSRGLHLLLEWLVAIICAFRWGVTHVG